MDSLATGPIYLSRVHSPCPAPVHGRIYIDLSFEEP